MVIGDRGHRMSWVQKTVSLASYENRVKRFSKTIPNNTIVCYKLEFIGFV